jgi:branched-chain amino acid aminotransferase
VEETGASNFLLIDSERVITPALTDSFLHGVTRDTVLSLAAELGYSVEERPLAIDEVLAWAARPDAEAAVSGTAAVLSGVGALIHQGQRTTVGQGQVGPHTIALRRALTDLHAARSTDHRHWLTAVMP